MQETDCRVEADGLESGAAVVSEKLRSVYRR
jgi:hypothetical protein